LAQRTIRDLSPIYVGFAPDEVRGLVDSVNRLLSRLETAIGSREQFIGNIAHQIRTPLAGIKLQAQLAQRAQDPQQVHSALERISTAADQMAHVNSQLLKLARAEAASGRGLRTEPVDLTALARECVDELSEMAREREVRLQLHEPAQPLKVTAELTLLREMLLNLLQNAIEYGRKGGEVQIYVAQAARGPVLAVEDDGPGIGREHWPRIFERFFRPTGASGNGCGLGLAIVREIALAHRATVELEEPERGSGTRFVVRFGVESS
jgi:two-component system sensor histidine kinase TctE